jgi:hypothetical protein
MPMRHLNATIGNRTRDLPACNAVPQTIAPPRKTLKRRYKVAIAKMPYHQLNKKKHCFQFYTSKGIYDPGLFIFIPVIQIPNFLFI